VYTVKFFKKREIPRFYTNFLLMIPIIAEISQNFGILDGTYDIFDILLYLITLIIFNL
jgi:hypothetical protein